MEFHLYNNWPMWLGRKPYARQWKRGGVEIKIDIFNNNAWLRILVEVCRCNLFVLGFGYDTYKRYPLTLPQHPHAFWFRFSVLGFGVWWRSKAQLPT